jgi:hypothetical protein
MRREMRAVALTSTPGYDAVARAKAAPSAGLLEVSRRPP